MKRLHLLAEAAAFAQQKPIEILVAIDAKGNLYVVDAEDGQVWRIGPDGKTAVHVKGATDAETCRHTHHLAIGDDGTLWLPSG